MLPEWLAYANFGLNLLLIPLVKWVWDVRVDLARLNGRTKTLEERLDRIDHRHDARDLQRSSDQ